jgi:hypothetical protein
MVKEAERKAKTRKVEESRRLATLVAFRSVVLYGVAIVLLSCCDRVAI